ncbi:molybdopterin molybdotransferase MoeA [Tissierella creatinophila]|uniref:Molybdopterin molybdenumtransferase n=1 Tax=Tissierella creatinophila DSM 6911 TaxID=1123403 RepID=A0A1U7M911_TISCR|nr:molybdopterin molybdotransferase MoeA [Tissierella creatinophila]OLS03730.1 molybdopterin molybdenumtransferase [Tissierella creatinophila DSM 6911]
MDFFKVVTVEGARETIMNNFREYKFELEEVDILDSLGRVLGKEVYCEIDVPEFNRSTVDGYAIVASDSHGASDSIPSVLNIVGEVHMGETIEDGIISGNAIYVPTGGMVPNGADGVIMIENTEKLDEETLLLNKPISIGENIIYKGDDMKKNSLVLEMGKKISPEAMGVLGALGKRKVKVFKKPRFYIISTGDEIIDIEEKLEFGKIRDINSFALFGSISALGGEVVGKRIVKDDFNLLKTEVEKAVNISDIVLISGGSSVGTRDFTKAVIDSFEGKGVFIHGLSVKPGKPTIVGEGMGKLIFGLPGHPVSSIIIFKVLVEDFVKQKMNLKEIKPQIRATMDFNFPSSSGKLTYQMVTLRKEDGKYFATPSFGKSSMISLLKDSDGYILLEKHEEGIYKGEERTVFLL